MSREEAAVAYLDVMLGSRGDYSQFCRAADSLSEQEKITLLDAVLEQRCIDETA